MSKLIGFSAYHYNLIYVIWKSERAGERTFQNNIDTYYILDISKFHGFLKMLRILV